MTIEPPLWNKTMNFREFESSLDFVESLTWKKGAWDGGLNEEGGSLKIQGQAWQVSSREVLVTAQLADQVWLERTASGSGQERGRDYFHSWLIGYSPTDEQHSCEMCKRTPGSGWAHVTGPHTLGWSVWLRAQVLSPPPQSQVYRLVGFVAEKGLWFDSNALDGGFFKSNNEYY